MIVAALILALATGSATVRFPATVPSEPSVLFGIVEVAGDDPSIEKIFLFEALNGSEWVFTLGVQFTAKADSASKGRALDHLRTVLSASDTPFDVRALDPGAAIAVRSDSFVVYDRALYRKALERKTRQKRYRVGFVARVAPTERDAGILKTRLEALDADVDHQRLEGNVVTFEIATARASARSLANEVLRDRRVEVRMMVDGRLRTVITNNDIIRADGVINADNAAEVNVEISPGAGKRLLAASERAIGTVAPILVDGKVVSEPRIMQPLSGPFLRVAMGRSGNVDDDFHVARGLAAYLSAGALKAGWKVGEVTPLKP